MAARHAIAPEASFALIQLADQAGALLLDEPLEDVVCGFVGELAGEEEEDFELACAVD